jgi:hypothetical protein
VEAKFSSNLADLDRIDWTILQNRDFGRNNDDIGKTSRYQAEALVHNHMVIGSLLHVACYDDNQKKWAEDLVKQRGLSLKIVTNGGWYF